MSTGFSCPKCGGSAKEDVQDVQYCLECGFVTSDCELVHEDFRPDVTFLAAGQSLPFARGGAPGNSRVYSLQAKNPLLIRSVKQLLSQLHISHGKLHERCQDIITSAQAKWHADGTPPVVPEVLVGLAVYIACREEGLLLYMQDVYNHLDVPAKAFGACFRRIMQDLQLRLPTMQPREVLDCAVGRLLGRTPTSKSILEDSWELVDWLQRIAPRVGLSSTPSMLAAMALATVCSTNKGQVQCSMQDIARQVRLAEEWVRIEFGKLKRVLLGEAQKVPWLRHLTAKTVAPHWRTLMRLDDASQRARLASAARPRVPTPPHDGAKQEAACAFGDTADVARPDAEPQTGSDAAVPPTQAEKSLPEVQAAPELPSAAPADHIAAAPPQSGSGAEAPPNPAVPHQNGAAAETAQKPAGEEPKVAPPEPPGSGSAAAPRKRRAEPREGGRRSGRLAAVPPVGGPGAEAAPGKKRKKQPTGRGVT